MQRHYTLMSLLTAFIVVTAAFGGYMNFKTSGFPMAVAMVDAHTAVIEPIEGIPMPAGIQAGDRIDLTAQSLATRIAIAIDVNVVSLEGNLPQGKTYDLAIERADAVVTVPVTTVYLSAASGFRFIQWINFISIVLIAGIALLTLWRGRDRAAAGMAAWTIVLVAGYAGIAPLDGTLGLFMLCLANFMFLLSRVAFYIMADAISRPMLSPRVRTLYLVGFVLLLTTGAAINSLGGLILYVVTGWAGGLSPQAGAVWTASYLVPVLLLFSCYRHATVPQRLRLRWMLWSGIVWVAATFISNTPFLGFHLSLLLNDTLAVISLAGFLYAVLRHRVVDVSVLLDRTLVYGATTALVVGVIAAMNSLALRATVGEGAGLLLQIIVPLALGIVLTRVRAALDRVVERVFFRKRYLAEKALRRFAKLSGRYEHADELLAAAVANIRQHLAARGVAIYERRGEEYLRIRQEGEVDYPRQARTDDTAFVAARADQDDIDLAELDSALGKDGNIFPMMAHGELQAVLVCANLPGVRYAADERALLAHVAHQMGMALYVLRMEAKAKVVDALARAPASALSEIQAQARSLATAVPAT